MFKCMILVILIITTILGQHSQIERSSGYQGKVVGGSDGPDGQFPYQISIRHFGQAEHICAGSIIDHEWIVTAAHCVDGASPSALKVVAGSNQLSSGGTSYSVTEIHMHKDYDSYYAKNDVALLKVESIVYTEKVGPIILENEDVGGGEPCTLGGWGMAAYPGPVSDNLQHINLTTTSLEYCKEINHPINESQICTLTKTGEGACRFDSGGPLVRTVEGVTKQIGIVSWIILCAKGYPDVYTRISFYHNWFNETCGCI